MDKNRVRAILNLKILCINNNIMERLKSTSGYIDNKI